MRKPSTGRNAFWGGRFECEGAKQKFSSIADIEQVKNEKKSFIFRCMLRQRSLEDAGEGQPWQQSM
jgi:hypothetical protein